MTMIYLDHSATTPLRPEVLAAMEPYYGTTDQRDISKYGNPSSIHRAGRAAHAGLSEARQTIANVLGVNPNEIVFTGCGSESDNAALRGIALARRTQYGADRIITTPVEHHAVLYTAEDLRDCFGFELTLLPVDGDGLVSADDLDRALGDGSDVAVVSVMYANNEIGSVQAIGELGALCRERKAPFHTDAVQAAGKLPLDVNELNVDALSASAHKFYGPKGVGFLYLRRGTPFHPFLTGGSHEGRRRAGTQNVPGIVGMATALALCEAERETEMARLRQLRDRIIGHTLESVEGARLTGSQTNRLANHASFTIRDVEAEGILIALDLAGIAASSGSACTSARQRPSHVLEAVGVPVDELAGGLRLSLGLSNDADQVDFLLEKLPQIVDRHRQISPAPL
ncbi:MAG: cysteine desulfurase [Caldilineaceae bacterium SB0664_bin_27]|uniref:cysteine desulfurase n=1 Tax=Caldilineaceae bacterium SB0664_bin_27 TaxID=2605260 RepID=A0A6B0YWC2_9CHLR|nr:cysteine desulfurase [Caldilineaceae bacterium SB0664_bin_27]